MPDPAAPPARLTTVLGIAAAMDLLTGLVLAAVGFVQGTAALAIAGVVLLVSGTGVMSYVIWQRSKPATL